MLLSLSIKWVMNKNKHELYEVNHQTLEKERFQFIKDLGFNLLTR